ncbi:MAG: cytochrome c class I [Bacteroidetes bacterium]|nr:MAG: cytochrome c class I [Bacteroidota bacterium]
MKHLSITRFGSLLIAFSLVCIGRSMAQSKPWTVPKEYASLTNPNTNNQQEIKEGKTLYTAYCTPCHGDKGKGDGVAAASLTPKPADHSSPTMINETDGNLFYKITEGRTPMPQFKTTLTEKQRWELVLYIRTLCKTAKK